MLAKVELKCWPSFLGGAEDGQHFDSKMLALQGE